MEFKIVNQLNENDKNEIFNQLLNYNLERIEDKNPQDIGIFYEDNNKNKLAGLIGDTHGNWLTIEFLWVDEKLRGRKIGTEILKKAEDIAKSRGCKFSFLNTFNFQAPQFYIKQGYEQAFVLEQYPLTGKRYYYIKKLY